MQHLRSTRWLYRFLALATLVSLAGAGLASAADHPAGAARPELTLRGDRAFAARLPALAGQLQLLADDADELAAAGRTVLLDLGGDTTAVEGDLLDGDRALGALLIQRDQLSVGYAALTQDVDLTRTSAPVRSLAARFAAAISEVDALAAAWSRLRAAAGPPSRLVALLGEHDRRVLVAMAAATGGDYTGGLESLAEADRALLEAMTLQDASGQGDAPRLDEPLRQAEDYDIALGRLFTLLRDSGGTITDAVRSAQGDVERARAALPEAPGSLATLASQMARDGINDPLLEIDRVRGELADALDALDSPLQTPG